MTEYLETDRWSSVSGGDDHDESETEPNPIFFQLVIHEPIFYDHFFDISLHFKTYDDLIYAAEKNNEHYFDTHLFQPREVLLQNAVENYQKPKSVFLETLSKSNVLDLVVETLLNPNIGVESQHGHVIKIRKRYVIYM